MRYGFGVDLGGTTVKIAFFDETGTLLEKWEIPTVTENSGARILPDISASVKDCMKRKNIPAEDILGIGIGVPGPVLPDGTVNRCINLGWGVFNIEKALQSLTGYPVKAGNDATVAALGECWKGGGKGCDSMVLVTLGTGVGGGVVIGGRAVHGAHGAGGEIGHIVIDPEETEVCGCGNRGCAEQYCSATGVVRMAKGYLAQNKKCSSLRGKDPLTCKDVFDAAADEDPVAKEILEQVYDRMAYFVASVCNVIDPEVVVLGGGVSKAGQPLLDGISGHFGKYVFHAVTGVRFALAELGNDAGAYGAFKLLLDQ